MKKIILLVALMGSAVGIGAFAGEAHASGYWDYSMGQRGTHFSGSPSAAEADTESEQKALELNAARPSNDSLELEEFQEIVNEDEDENTGAS